jgi:hypothetical protein
MAAEAPKSMVADNDPPLVCSGVEGQIVSSSSCSDAPPVVFVAPKTHATLMVEPVTPIRPVTLPSTVTLDTTVAPPQPQYSGPQDRAQVDEAKEVLRRWIRQIPVPENPETAAEYDVAQEGLLMVESLQAIIQLLQSELGEKAATMRHALLKHARATAQDRDNLKDDKRHKTA